MGEPLYLCQPPTGYADTAEAWVNAGALLARVNFAVALTEGRGRGHPAGSERARRRRQTPRSTWAGPEFQRQ